MNPLATVHAMITQASGSSSKPKVELDSHAETSVICDNVKSYVMFSVMIEKMAIRVTD